MGKWGSGLVGSFPAIFFLTVFQAKKVHTVAGIVINDYPILHCKIPILRVGVWPIWVGPAHCPFDQLIIYTSMVTYQKMSNFYPVVLKWQTFVFY